MNDLPPEPAGDGTGSPHSLGIHEPAKLAREIQFKKQDIINYWQNLMRVELSNSPSTVKSEVIETLPDYIDHICAELNCPGGDDLASIWHLAKDHAERRAHIDGYSLDQIIVEHSHLREAIFKVVETGGKHIPPDARDIIRSRLLIGIRAAAAGFAKTMHARERASHAKTENILASAGDGIFGVDLDGHITFANTAATEMVGWNAKEMINQSLQSLLGRSPQEHPLYKAIHGENLSVLCDDVLTRKDGTQCPVALRMSPMVIEGAVVGAVIVARDITDKIRAEQALREREEWLQLAVEAAKVAIWDWNLATKKLKWSEQNQRLWGYKLGEFDESIDGFWKRIHPDDRARIEKVLEEASKTGRDYRAEYRVIWPDNSVHWISASGRMFFGFDGKPARMTGTAIEITEQKLFEETLKRNQERYDLALKAGRIGVWEFDLRSAEMTWSKRQFEIYGIDPNKERLDDEMIKRFIHPDDLPSVLREWDKALRQQRDFISEFRVVRSDGSVRWIQSHGHPFIDEKGKPCRVTGTNVDITDRKLRELSEIQEKEFREQFVSTLTHDLRTPITSAKMSLRLLIRELKGDSPLSRLIARIEESLIRSDKMIQNLLDANLVRAGKPIPINKEYCDLTSVAMSVIDDMITLHGNRFVITGPSMPGEYDSSQLRRVLENLICNAVKYGSEQTPITITLSSDEKVAVIAVHNFGAAIQSQDLAKLFHPFHRSESALAAGKKGWGIGLTLVRGVVESHGGSVSVVSGAEGTTFTVKLPRR